VIEGSIFGHYRPPDVVERTDDDGLPLHTLGEAANAPFSPQAVPSPTLGTLYSWPVQYPAAKRPSATRISMPLALPPLPRLVGVADQMVRRGGGARRVAIGVTIATGNVATDSKAFWPRIREASRSHASDSPLPGEVRVSRMPANDATGSGGRTVSGAG
jgi:hypothetical protein